jgi:hypothetical protein
LIKSVIYFAVLGAMSANADASIGTASDEMGRHCFYLDRHGQALGAPIDDSNCHVGYRTEVSPFPGDGRRFCFNTDEQNEIYGAPVDPSNCHASFRISKDPTLLMGSDQRFCFHADTNGIIYDSPVDSSNCNDD